MSFEHAKKKCLQIISEVEGDERHHYPDANVIVNAPLALIQVQLEQRKRTAKEILKELQRHG